MLSVGALPQRVYVGHSVYKGKAALSVAPTPPEFTALDVCFFWLLVLYIDGSFVRIFYAVILVDQIYEICE